MTPAGGTELYAWDVSTETSTIIYNAGLNFKNSDNFVTPTQEGKNVTADNGYLMVIPQTTTNAEIVVTIDNGTNTDTEKIFSIPTGTEWKANAHYIYSLKLSGPDYWIPDPNNPSKNIKIGESVGILNKVGTTTWWAPVNAGYSETTPHGLLYNLGHYGEGEGFEYDHTPGAIPPMRTGTCPYPSQGPCPTGWRVPNRKEFEDLTDMSTPRGGAWCTTNTMYNNDNFVGRWYGKGAQEAANGEKVSTAVFFSCPGHSIGKDLGIGQFVKHGLDGRYMIATNSTKANYLYFFRVSKTTPNGGQMYGTEFNTVLFTQNNGIPYRCVADMR